MEKNRKNNNPYIICMGSPCKFTSAVVVCNGKVITIEIGKMVFSAVLVLLAVHYTYELSFCPLIHQVMEFIQEGVIGDRLPLSRKISTPYSIFFVQ